MKRVRKNIKELIAIKVGYSNVKDEVIFSYPQKIFLINSNLAFLDQELCLLVAWKDQNHTQKFFTQL